jgi:hypothetical protein
VKTLVAPAKTTSRRPPSKWLAGGSSAAISQKQADGFTDGLLEIAAGLTGLPTDFAKNHDHYLHGLPRK